MKASLLTSDIDRLDRADTHPVIVEERVENPANPAQFVTIRRAMSPAEAQLRGLAGATPATPESRYRAAEGADDMPSIEPDWPAIENVVYARVTPLHYLAVIVVLWLSIAAAAWLVLDLIGRLWP